LSFLREDYLNLTWEEMTKMLGPMLKICLQLNKKQLKHKREFILKKSSRLLSLLITSRTCNELRLSSK